jgi:hypothetical protein
VNMGWDRIVMVGEKDWLAQKDGGGLRQEMTRWRDGRSENFPNIKGFGKRTFPECQHFNMADVILHTDHQTKPTWAKKTPSSGSLHWMGGMNQACLGAATGRGPAASAFRTGGWDAPPPAARGAVLGAPPEERGRSGRRDAGGCCFPATGQFHRGIRPKSKKRSSSTRFWW